MKGWLNAVLFSFCTSLFIQIAETTKYFRLKIVLNIQNAIRIPFFYYYLRIAYWRLCIKTENSQWVKIGIFRFIRSCSKSGKLQAKIETMDRGMICPSFVFDHFRYSPKLCLWISARGWGCRIRFHSFQRFFQTPEQEDGQYEAPSFLVYII